MHWIALQPQPEPAGPAGLADVWTALGWWALQFTPQVVRLDDAVLLDTTMALANRLAGLSARALAATRQVIDEASGLDFDAALSLEARVQGAMSRGHDFAEGVAAFLEKRPAVFTDR